MPKHAFFIFNILILFCTIKFTFAQKNSVDVIKLQDDSVYFGHILQNVLNDSLVLFLSNSGDSIFFNKKNIMNKFKLKYEFEDHKIKVINNNPYSSAFLSFLLPGGGQFYNEEYWKGSAQLGLVIISGLFTDAIKPFYIYDYGKQLNWPDYINIAAQLWSLIDAPISSVNINKELRNKYDVYFKPIEERKNLSTNNRKKILFSLKIQF